MAFNNSLNKVKKLCGVVIMEAYEPIFQVGKIENDVVLFTPMLKDSPLEKDVDFVTFVQYVKDEFKKSEIRTTLKVLCRIIDGIVVLYSPCVDDDIKKSNPKSVKEILKTL